MDQQMEENIHENNGTFLKKILSKLVKLIYSEKVSVDLSYEVPVKYMVDISQNFVASSEYINFSNQIDF